jgi:hypothetical protein
MSRGAAWIAGLVFLVVRDGRPVAAVEVSRVERGFRVARPMPTDPGDPVRAEARLRAGSGPAGREGSGHRRRVTGPVGRGAGSRVDQG